METIRTKKALTSIDQINILLKRARRENYKIDYFKTYNDNVVYCFGVDGSYFTIYTFIENANSLFVLI